MSAKTALIIAPHQDDEVLGCGGLIALKRQAGIRVKIIFVTDGSASHESAAVEPRPDLPGVRRREALKAAEILGVAPTDVHFLEWPDGGLRELDSQQRRQLIAQVALLLDSFRPGEVYVPHRHDRTDDHEATYELAIAAVESSGVTTDVFQYAVWLLWSSLVFRDFRLEEFDGARCLRIDSVRDLKRRALEAHRSQWQPKEKDERPVLQSALLYRFCLPHEVFFRTDPGSPSSANVNAGIGRAPERPRPGADWKRRAGDATD